MRGGWRSATVMVATAAAVCGPVLAGTGQAATAAPRPAAGARAASGRNWGKAGEVLGIAALNAGGLALVGTVSCASAGNCSAGGSYTDRAGARQVHVVSQVRGSWGRATEVPGAGALNRGGFARVTSVSCAPAGTCSAGGPYQDGSAQQQAFVVST
jgi:hypothetical protein